MGKRKQGYEMLDREKGLQYTYSIHINMEGAEKWIFWKR